MTKDLQKVKRHLDKHGLLMLTDPALPSLVSTIAGAPVSGTWWSHPQGNLMHNLSNDLANDPDILTVKFINKKITYLDRRHWDAFFTIAISQVDWKMKKLPPACLSLFKNVEAVKELRADDPSLKKTAAEIGKLSTKLEERILVYSESIHTVTGKHIRVLKTWKAFMKSRKIKIKQMTYEDAVAHFEKLGYEFLDKYEVVIKWPWKS